MLIYDIHLLFFERLCADAQATKLVILNYGIIDTDYENGILTNI